MSFALSLFTKLQEFVTFISLDDLLLTAPTVIKYDGDSRLFVYGNSRGTVLELDENGDVVNEFGRRGQGEVLMVNNIFLTESFLYIVDVWQFFIHRYDRNGEFLSSLDYGSLGYVPDAPPPPFSPTFLRAERIVNEPHVTLTGDVLLSPVSAGVPSETVYKRKDWEGNHLSDIGTVPESSSFTYDADKFRADIINRGIPSFYKPNSFPVNDPANPDEYFLIYSSIPNITKYRADRERLWLHRFDSEGTLVHRYKILSEDAEVLPIFDIDFSGSRIFVVTEDGEIRAYSFQEVL